MVGRDFSCWASWWMVTTDRIFANRTKESYKFRRYMTACVSPEILIFCPPSSRGLSPAPAGSLYTAVYARLLGSNQVQNFFSDDPLNVVFTSGFKFRTILYVRYIQHVLRKREKKDPTLVPWALMAIDVTGYTVHHTKTYHNPRPRTTATSSYYEDTTT